MRPFRTRLLAWYGRRRRDLPWRTTLDPYRIWVSEIMLQQTRAQTAIPYYQRFLERFPTVESLAAASEEGVLAAWSGLGYYSRARNLHLAAKQAAAGGFPRDYESIRALPGVGPYTAAAIASIAFGLAHAALDGNVMRVIARLEDDAADLSSSRTRERLRGIAQELLDPRRPGEFNQAMMELGATVCVPRVPDCGACPVRSQCRAYSRGTASQLPVKLRKTEPQRIEAELALVRRSGRVLLWQRLASARRMGGFWELPSPEQLPGMRRLAVAGAFRHTITHHHYLFTVIAASIARAPLEMRWFGTEDLVSIPLSTTARKALAVAG
ncbi:MAG TPA: A/G-specific adenine glycosylase [Bryobacteraceae bacterium]|nr:A/G-specific adenine glycosylase [Bryobacteraceae bacterium]